MAYSVPPSSEPSIAQFSCSAAQNLASGTVPISYDTNASWNSPIVVNTYAAPPTGSTFTIGASGLYQVEANLSVAANGAGWTNPNQMKTLNLALTRSGVTAVIAAATVNITTGNNYSIHCSLTFPFRTGDTLQFQHISTLSSGTPTALGLQNGFDLNTWVSFQYIKSV